MTLTISNKGWVVIPAELRKKYRLFPGRAVQIVDYGGVLALIPSMDNPIYQSAGMLPVREHSLRDILLEEHKKELEGE